MVIHNLEPKQVNVLSQTYIQYYPKLLIIVLIFLQFLWTLYTKDNVSPFIIGDVSVVSHVVSHAMVLLIRFAVVEFRRLIWLCDNLSFAKPLWLTR